MEKIQIKHISILIVFLKISLIAIVAFKYLPQATEEDLTFNETFLWFILAGFMAQIVDGALGMAYGVTSNSILLGFGLSPKVASAAVHTAEVFTTGVSGLSHMKFGNFDKKLFFKLLVPGILSASLGAYLLGDVLDGKVIRPYIMAYLLILGILILLKAFKKNINTKENTKNASLFALAGGFLDSIGGGGWGPIVTSNLINQGNTPAKVIGTVNTAEFFVTYTSAGILIYFAGIQSWQIILGLIIGGTIAAPLGAYITKKIPKRQLLIIVGTLIILTSLYTLSRVIF
ncbi:sulfite exporter TauE/SafE family protein [Arenibacter sp. GZD96]|uniref:sulfite exporter TauE/SafE family protein n=1 Tax=Aurantibrevibacter litoralis TaxID=3106030 RepID=UPI002AFFBF87|nr:sulfite exporter TauE/SafE family protein [Arenibacter sp. GZD-96]MEA1785331.1 sulfite exporter TauE/SafE family protein [Arenibacter sp. GZD-96]